MTIRTLLWIAAGGLASASPLAAQLFVPARSEPDKGELNSRLNYPLMRSHSRSQFVISASELSGTGSLSSLSFRLDGPSIGNRGATLGDLEIHLAPAAVAPALSSPVFASNWGANATLVVALQNHSVAADNNPNPEGWGRNNELRFVFSQAYSYAGGDLIVEIGVRNNSNGAAGTANLMLDAETDPLTGALGGSAQRNGLGCDGSSLDVAGQLAPGGQFTCSATGLGANQPVVVFLGTSRSQWGSLPLPLALDLFGMLNCFIYNDWLVDQNASTDANGRLAPYAGIVWPLPANPAFNGAVLQVQSVAVKLGANSANLVSTNNVQITLGTYTPLVRGFMAHFHHSSRDAALATLSAPVVPAMRFN